MIEMIKVELSDERKKEIKREHKIARQRQYYEEHPELKKRVRLNSAITRKALWQLKHRHVEEFNEIKKQIKEAEK